jgi:predicted RNA-binding Zn-ribbon protein involved in translation (DUF1610 family)
LEEVKMEYVLKKCTVCGASIPVNVEKSLVECGFCGSVYEVKRVNGKPSPELGWFLAGVIVGFLIGWPASRAALAAVGRVTMEELERRVEEWGRRG